MITRLEEEWSIQLKRQQDQCQDQVVYQESIYRFMSISATEKPKSLYDSGHKIAEEIYDECSIGINNATTNVHRIIRICCIFQWVDAPTCINLGTTTSVCAHQITSRSVS